jgi:hypothetical protein
MSKSEFTEADFYHLVRFYIEAHPEWVGAATQAMTDGQAEYIRKLQHQNAAVETGFFTYKGTERKRGLLATAVRNLRCFGNTPAQAEMLRVLQPETETNT